MNFNNYTIKSQEAIQKATEIAGSNQQQAIETGHILKGIQLTDENVIPFLAKKLGVNLNMLNTRLDTLVEVCGERPAPDGVGDGRLDGRAELRERRIGFDRAVRDPRAHLGLDLILRERGRGAVSERLLVEHGDAAVERERADHEQEHPTREQRPAHP